jgi:hypothetical protein
MSHLLARGLSHLVMLTCAYSVIPLVQQDLLPRTTVSRHDLRLTTVRLRCLTTPGTVRWLTSRSTGRCATTFRVYSSKAPEDAHHQPSVLDGVWYSK